MTLLSRKNSAATLAIVAALVLLSSAAFFQGVPVGAQLAPNLIATTVQGSLDPNNPGQESFWSQITGAQIPLTASNDYGGATKSVSVKMANNGTHILVYASWSDPTQSRLARNTIENGSFPALFYANSTYSYEDRIVFWWSLDQTPGPPPCMQKACTSPGPGCIDSSGKGHGEGESLAGTGNLWHWKAARTDSSGSVYGKLKYGSGPNKGQPLIPAHSYADNEFINKTGHYQLGWDQYPTKAVPGNFTIASGENSIPYNTFVVYAHGVYDSSTHTWNWEAARTLKAAPTLHTVQFAPNRTYYFAVAAFDGGPIPIPAAVGHPAGWTMYGENEETKSISAWYTMALSPAAPTTTSTTATTTQPGVSTVTATQTQTVTSTETAPAPPSEGGLTFSLALIVAIGTLIVGLVAGMVVRPIRQASGG